MSVNCVIRNACAYHQRRQYTIQHGDYSSDLHDVQFCLHPNLSPFNFYMNIQNFLIYQSLLCLFFQCHVMSIHLLIFIEINVNFDF